MIRDDACSLQSAAEPLAGTTPYARAWLILEHPGRWGRDALTQSGIPEPVVAHISQAQSQVPLRFLAARRLDQDRRQETPASRRRVWMAFCDSRGGHTRVTTIADLSQILDWDLAALAAGVFPTDGELLEDPTEFICAHSKRDSCCAVLGRERIASVPAELHEQVWECSHLGGHRFAATSLFLPSGRMYGRLPRYRDDHQHVAWEPDPRHLRGPSYLPPPLQAAECSVRVSEGLSAAENLDVVELETIGSVVVVEVTSQSNQRWLVESTPDTFTSAASCGAQALPRTMWRAQILAEGS